MVIKGELLEVADSNALPQTQVRLCKTSNVINTFLAKYSGIDI